MKKTVSVFGLLFLLVGAAVAQETTAVPTNPSAPPGNAEPPKTNIEATLLILQSDWSKSSSAREIENDLRAVLKDYVGADDLYGPDSTGSFMAGEMGTGEGTEEMYGESGAYEEESEGEYGGMFGGGPGMGYGGSTRATLPEVAVRILFPSHSAAVYRPEDLDRMLAWLKKYKLIKSMKKGESLSDDFSDRSLATLCFGEDTIPAPLLGNPVQPEDVLMVPRGEWLAYFRRTDSQVSWDRYLNRIQRQWSGGAKPVETLVGKPDHVRMTVDLPADRAIVVNWFAFGGVRNSFLELARRKGIEPVVILRDPATRLRFLDEPESTVPAEVKVAEGFLPVTFPSDRSPAGADAMIDESMANKPEDPTQPTPPAQVSRELKVFRLAHSNAHNVSEILRQLFRNVQIAADQTTNSVIVMGPAEDLKEIEPLLLRLDTDQRDKVDGTEDDQSSYESYYEEAAPPVATLRANYRQLEQQAAQLAQQYRVLSSKENPKPGEAESLQRQLTDVVTRAFDTRQKLQWSELNQLQRRLEKVGERIAARDRIKDAIVEHRVKELLNPELQWQPPNDTSEKASELSEDGQTPPSGRVGTGAPPSGEHRTASPLILRSAAEFRRDLASAEGELKACLREEEAGNAPASLVEQARQKLAFVRDEYDAQIRLLELELEKATAAAEHAEQRRALLQRQYKAGLVPQLEMAKATQDADAANSDVERLDTLLELYRKAAPP